MQTIITTLKICVWNPVLSCFWKMNDMALIFCEDRVNYYASSRGVPKLFHTFVKQLTQLVENIQLVEGLTLVFININAYK